MYKRQELEVAYGEIKKKLGIDAIRLDQIPPELVYKDTVISGDTATMLFKYGNSNFNIIQQIRSVGNSSGITSEDVYKRQSDDMVLEQDKVIMAGDINVTVRNVVQSARGKE